MNGNYQIPPFPTLNLSELGSGAKPAAVPAWVPGVGRDAPTVVNAAGGKQSHSPYRADLLPPLATLEVARVLREGAAKYGEDNWRKIEAKSLLNHALVHCLAWLAGDRSDDHLSHAACRLLMALDLELSAARSDGIPQTTYLGDDAEYYRSKYTEGRD